jgi:hypothetical protein
MVHICVVSPKVAKASRDGVIAAQNRQCFLPKNFANVNEPVSFVRLPCVVREGLINERKWAPFVESIDI